MRIALAHRLSETAVNGSSIGLNVILLYLIKNHSAFGTRVYQVMLTIDASLDLTLSVFILITQPICFIGGGYKEFISNGFFANRWYAFDQFLIFGCLVVVHFNIMWVVVQFVYRYAYICLRETYCYPEPEVQPPALHVLEQNYWDLTASTPIVVGAEIVGCTVIVLKFFYGFKSSWILKAWIVMWTVNCMGSSAVVIIYEFKMKTHFRSAPIAHDTTRRMHKDFHRALLAMVVFDK